jgi:hypothetical protein
MAKENKNIKIILEERRHSIVMNDTNRFWGDCALRPEVFNISFNNGPLVTIYEDDIRQSPYFLRLSYFTIELLA